MILITHPSHLKVLPSSKFKQHLHSLIHQHSKETDVPAIIFTLRSDDNPNSPDFQFVGSNGLLSDLFDEHQPSEEGYQNCFEWIFYHENLKCYEALHLEHGEFAAHIFIQESATSAHPDLLLALHSQPLLENLPF